MSIVNRARLIGGLGLVYIWFFMGYLHSGFDGLLTSIGFWISYGVFFGLTHFIAKNHKEVT